MTMKPVNFERHKTKSLTERITKNLRAMITTGNLKLGEKLPSEPELAKVMGVSRNSLREAIGLLENEGFLSRRQGIGTFITESLPVIRGGIERLRGVVDFIREQGYTPGSKVTRFAIQPCSEAIAEKLLISSGDEVTVLETTKTASGHPVAICSDIIPNTYLRSKTDAEKMQTSIFEALREIHGIDICFAECDIVPTVADEALASELDVPFGSPILLLESIHYDNLNRRVLFSRSYFPAGKFAFKLIRRR